MRKQGIKLSGNVVGEVEMFKYLEYVVQNDRGFEEDIKTGLSVYG